MNGLQYGTPEEEKRLFDLLSTSHDEYLSESGMKYASKAKLMKALRAEKRQHFRMARIALAFAIYSRSLESGGDVLDIIDLAKKGADNFESSLRWKRRIKLHRCGCGAPATVLDKGVEKCETCYRQT